MGVLFCNIGWMENYNGEDSDEIINGGSYVNEMKTGHEDRNFLSFDGKYYGYVRNRGTKFDLERISADALPGSPYIDGVDIIWTATSPLDGNVVIGWYRNARVFRKMQRLNANTVKPRVHYDDEECYWFEAEAKKCLLLPIEERTVRVPRNGKGLMGTTPFWYGDSPEGADFVARVKRLINLRTPLLDENVYNNIATSIYNVNSKLRKETEISAINKTTEHYEKLGYIVKSVERDNVGWDLEVSKGDDLLRVEVKGLFGLGRQVQLTPNEYKHFQKNEMNYRLCIVNNALSLEDYGLFICYFDHVKDCWSIENFDSGEIKFKEYTSAIVQLNI